MGDPWSRPRPGCRESVHQPRDCRRVGQFIFAVGFPDSPDQDQRRPGNPVVTYLNAEPVGDGDVIPVPLPPDHPRKGDPEFDAGTQLVRAALDGGRHLVVLSRPAATDGDGRAQTKQREAWRSTYLAWVVSGEPFVECEDILSSQVQQCWITEPAPAPTEQPEPVHRLANQRALGAA